MQEISEQMSGRVLLTIFSLLIVSTVFSQSIKLTGKVTNEKNEPVAGASVNIGSGKGLATGVDGRFTLSVVPGRYELTVSAVGYETKIISDIDVAAGIVRHFIIIS